MCRAPFASGPRTHGIFIHAMTVPVRRLSSTSGVARNSSWNLSKTNLKTGRGRKDSTCRNSDGSGATWIPRPDGPGAHGRLESLLHPHRVKHEETTH